MLWRGISHHKTMGSPQTYMLWRSMMRWALHKPIYSALVKGYRLLLTIVHVNH